MVELDKPMTTILYGSFVFVLVTKPIAAHSEYIILFAYLLQQLYYESTSKLLYMYIAYIVKNLSVML